MRQATSTVRVEPEASARTEQAARPKVLRRPPQFAVPMLPPTLESVEPPRAEALRPASQKHWQDDSRFIAWLVVGLLVWNMLLAAALHWIDNPNSTLPIRIQQRVAATPVPLFPEVGSSSAAPESGVYELAPAEE